MYNQANRNQLSNSFCLVPYEMNWSKTHDLLLIFRIWGIVLAIQLIDIFHLCLS